MVRHVAEVIRADVMTSVIAVALVVVASYQGITVEFQHHAESVTKQETTGRGKSNCYF